MRIRAEERRALVALLDAGDHETVEELAEAVFSLVADQLAQRESYVTAVDLSGLTLVYSATDLRMAKKLAAGSDRAVVFKVHPGVTLLDRLAEKRPTGACGACGHPDLLHDWPKARKVGCTHRSCPCERFVEPNRKEGKVA